MVHEGVHDGRHRHHPRRGGTLKMVRPDIVPVCPAANIPERITAGLEGLDTGDSVHISPVSCPLGTRPPITRDFPIASGAAPPAVREEQAAAAAAAAAA